MRIVAHDLALLWSQTHIPWPVRARLAELGYTGVGVFALLDDNAVKVRGFAKDRLGMDTAAEDLRATLSRVVEAWGVAHTRGQKRQEVESGSF